MRIMMLILLLCSASAFVCAIDLEQSIQLARENNKTLLMAEQEVLMADQTYYDVRSNLLPHLTLSSGYQLTRTYLPDSSIIPPMDFSLGLDSLATSNDNYLAGALTGIMSSLVPTSPVDEGSLAVSLQFQQVLFMGGKLINGIKAVDRYRSIQRLQYKLKEQDVVLSTTQLFYACLLTDKLVTVQQEGLDTARRHLNHVEAFSREGMVSEFDLLRARLEVAKMEPQLIESQNARDLALAAFRKQIGKADGNDIPSGEFILPAEMSITLEQALEQGSANRLENELADIATQVSEIKWNAEKGNYLPNVAIQGSASLFTAADEFAIESEDFGTSYNIGIGVSFPLFTGFSNTAKRKQTHHDYIRSKLQQQDIEEMIRLQITQNHQKLRSAEENYKIQIKNIEMAERSLQLAQIRYDNQVGIQLEVFDAQTMLSAIKLQFYQAIYEVISAQRELLKSIGTTL